MVNDPLSGVTEGSSQMNTWSVAQMIPGPLGGVWIGWECRKDVVGPWWKCGSSPICDCGERQTVSHLMTCVDAPNYTWTDLAMPNITGVNCGKHWEESIWQSIEDSMKKKNFRETAADDDEHEYSSSSPRPTTVEPPTRSFTAELVEPLKGALYIIQILCRRYTFWSYPTGLTIADPAG